VQVSKKLQLISMKGTKSASQIQISLQSKLAAFLWLHNVKCTSQFLPRDKLQMVIHAFVTSRIGYCNSLLFGLPNCELAKLQRVQNVAARLLTSPKKYDHITPVLRELHWLPVRFRIQMCFRQSCTTSLL